MNMDIDNWEAHLAVYVNEETQTYGVELAVTGVGTAAEAHAIAEFILESLKNSSASLVAPKSVLLQ